MPYQLSLSFSHLHTVDIPSGLHSYDVCVLIEHFVGDWAVVLACRARANTRPQLLPMHIPSTFLWKLSLKRDFASRGCRH